MEKQVIVAELVKSNMSDNQVWFVHVNGSDNPEHMGYCKHAIKALQFCFILKARTQGSIDADTMRTLKEFYAENEKGKLNWYKPRQKKEEQPTEAAAEDAAKAEQPKKRGRKPAASKNNKVEVAA